jgi:tetratricopeptide (TPR) repeat protein
MDNFIVNNILMKRTTFSTLVVFLFFLWPLLSLSQTAADYNKKAKECYDKKDYAGVISNATMSINLTPSGEAYWWRGVGNYYSKNYQVAASDYTKAITYYTSGTKSSLASLYVLRADCYFEMEDYESAFEDYDEALTKYEYSTNKFKVYKSMALSVDRAGYPDDAIGYYTKAIEQTTSSTELAELYLYRGDAKMAVGKYTTKEIVADFTSGITKDNQNATLYFKRGISKYQDKQYTESLPDFLETIRLDLKKINPDSFILKRLAQCYGICGGIKNFQGKPEEARADYMTALKYDTRNGYIYWDLANMFKKTTSYTDVVDYYKKGLTYLTNTDDHINCYFDYYLYERIKLRYGPAIQILNDAIKTHSSAKAFYWARAYVNKLRKEYTNSIADYDKAIAMYKKDTLSLVDIYIERSNVLIKQNNTSDALKDIQRAVALKPGFTSYYTLGRFFKTTMKQNELGNGNLQKAMQMSLAETRTKDTTADYAYASAMIGDKATTERLVSKLIIEASAKAGKLAAAFHDAACMYTMLGNYTKALEYLDQSLAAGYTDFDHLVFDADLEALTSLPAYKAILTKYKVPVPIL